jgi:hypothetical protein
MSDALLLLLLLLLLLAAAVSHPLGMYAMFHPPRGGNPAARASSFVKWAQEKMFVFYGFQSQDVLSFKGRFINS